MLCLLLPPGFPSRNIPQKLVGPVSLETQVSMPHVCKWAGEMSGPGLDGGYSTRAPTLGSMGTAGNVEEKITSAIPFTALHHK